MKIRKIFLTIVIFAILSTIFVFAVSASESDFLSTANECSDTSSYLGTEFIKYIPDPYFEDEFVTLVYSYDADGCNFIRPSEFKRFIDYIGFNTYSSFVEFCNISKNLSHLSDETRSFLSKWSSVVGGFDELYFNKLYFYTEITQADLDAKNAVIAENMETIDKLEENLSYSRNQVTTLSQSRGELLAVNASLEKQLQNKINLAYAQGLVDSGSTSDVVPILIGVITLLEGVALVILIVSKIKNRKKGR